MTDEERPRRRMQTNTERDMSGLERLRAERARDKLHRAAKTPVPIHEFDADINTGRTERIDQDQDLSRLYAKSEHTRALVMSAKREVADIILEAVGERPPEDRFKAIEKRVKFWHWIATAIAIPAIASIAIVVKYLQAKSASDERAIVQREQLLERVRTQDLEIVNLKTQLREVENLARRNETRLDSWRRNDARNVDVKVNQ